MAEFLNNHNILHISSISSSVLPNSKLLCKVLLLHTHFLKLNLLNIFYTNFLIFLAFYKNISNVNIETKFI